MERELHEEKEIATSMSKRTHLTLEVTGAALFGAMSLVLSAFLTPIIPRVPGWGIAIIDPVSILWITCFLIFGPKSGLLCCIIGTLALFPFDPFSPIGPLMKLSATVSLIIVPIILLRLYKIEPGLRNSQKYKKLTSYIFTGLLGIILRIIIMMIFNVLLFLTLWSSFLDFTDLGFIGLPSISGWNALIIGVIIINAETSVWDLLIPYLVVYGLKLDQRYEIW
ncbi:MAG: ECF transporter S component [Candidatus Lokiarchaeota archaeon]|nr:ECF transporter S component [Candidatus Lokiarchaeota archaeon]